MGTVQTRPAVQLWPLQLWPLQPGISRFDQAYPDPSFRSTLLTRRTTQCVADGTLHSTKMAPRQRLKPLTLKLVTLRPVQALRSRLAGFLRKQLGLVGLVLPLVGIIRRRALAGDVRPLRGIGAIPLQPRRG